MKTKIIACLGKGGTGKTAISTLIGKFFIESGLYPLFVDADPVFGLQKTLGIEKSKSIAEARLELIEFAKNRGIDNAEDTEEAIDFIVMNVLLESEGYGFLSMGQSSDRGCFCPVNNLLKKTLKRTVSSFSHIIIDAEAGVEQVSRMVVENIDHAFLITDVSKRGVDTCVTINDTIRRFDSMRDCSVSVIFNRTENVPSFHEDFLMSKGLAVAGCVPADDLVAESDMKGLPLIEIPTISEAYKAVSEIIKKEM